MAPTPNTFWQSDGPQPHFLNLHFFKLVKICRLRVYLDFASDESYTPTKMEFWGGWSSSYGLVQFAEWTGAEPRGWQEIPLDGCGVAGRSEIRCMVLQVRIMENHQNGKDTHLRGLQVFSQDERARTGQGPREKMTRSRQLSATPEADQSEQFPTKTNVNVLDDFEWAEELVLR